MILIEIGVNITPIIAGFSIVGIGFSLGSQTIIRDFLSGLFTIHENDFNIETKFELVLLKVSSKTFTLRKLHIRDVEGWIALMFPFGSITNVTNLSKEYIQAFVTIPLPENFHLQRTAQILEDVGKEMTKDENLASKIITAKIPWSKDFYH